LLILICMTMLKLCLFKACQFWLFILCVLIYIFYLIFMIYQRMFFFLMWTLRTHGSLLKCQYFACEASPSKDAFIWLLFCSSNITNPTISLIVDCRPFEMFSPGRFKSHFVVGTDMITSVCHSQSFRVVHIPRLVPTWEKEKRKFQ